jgi:hypothetical protein
MADETADENGLTVTKMVVVRGQASLKIFKLVMSPQYCHELPLWEPFDLEKSEGGEPYYP